MNRSRSLVLGILFWAGDVSARADTIVDQSSGPFIGTISSQEFSDVTVFTNSAFDDFTISEAHALGSLIVFGNEQGDPGDNVEVVAGIYAAPDRTTNPVLGVTGTQVGNDLHFDFAGALLDAGTYWVGAYVVRPNAGGQWFWNVREEVTGSEAFWHRPNGSPPLGPDPIPVSTLFNRPGDMAFTLGGVAVVPEPATLGLILGGLAIVAGLGRHRRGRAR